MGASLVVPAYQARSALNVARFSRCARRRAKEHCLSDHRPQICGRRRLRDSRASSGTGAISSCWCRRLLALAGPSIWQRCARGSLAELVALTPEKGALHSVFGALDRCLVGNHGRLDPTRRRNSRPGGMRDSVIDVIEQRAREVREGQWMRRTALRRSRRAAGRSTQISR